MDYNLIRPLLWRLDPETAHRLTILALRHGLAPKGGFEHLALETKVLGLSFRNPLGLAAGFDKDAQALPALFKMGFGFVEAGTVTPRAQSGNPRPRVFRDVENGAVINRMGFPGGGFEFFARNMMRKKYDGIVGVNIGMNKDAQNPIDDYCKGIEKFSARADYIAINISSPNTAGLRDLQHRSNLQALLRDMVATRNDQSRRAPLLLKIAPDLDQQARQDIAEIVLQEGVDGLIVSNTTLSRPHEINKTFAMEKGGLSGRPLMRLSTQLIADMYRLTQGRLPIIGVGGVSNAQDAYDKIKAGASLVQIYTALIFQGPQAVANILSGLYGLLSRDGISTVAQAVGTGQPLLKKVV